MTAITATPSDRPLSGTREQVATRMAFLAAGLAMAAWAPLVPFAKARLEVDEATLGLLLLCLGGGSILAMPITGILATRFGCRTVIIISGLITAAMLPLLALAHTVPLLALSLAIFGGSIGTLDVTMNIQAVMVEKDSGKSLMSGFHGLFSLGGIVGAGGVSLLLALGVAPLMAVLIISLAVLVLLFAAFAGLLPYGNASSSGTPLFVLPRGLIIFIGLLCFLTFLAEGAILDWSALFLIATHGVEPSQAGFGYTMFAIAMTAGRLLGDRIVSGLGGTRVILLGGLLCAMGFALAVFAPGQVPAFAGFLLVGLGASNIVPVLFSAAGRDTRMPPSLAIAAITTLGYAGILAGPALIGFIAQRWTLGIAFLLLAAAMAFVSANFWVAKR